MKVSLFHLVGLAQSFTVLNFTQINSLGIGTDTIIPIPNPDNPNFIADIQTQDFWGANSNDTIYRMTNVGIGNIPNVTLDVLGNTHLAGILTVTDSAFFDSTLRC